MCTKLPYCARHIDPCLRSQIAEINATHQYRAISSCCGHGIYTKTIIVKDVNGNIFEWYSGTKLSRYYKNGHVRKRYYQRDKKGYYFIPEVQKTNKQLRIDV